MIKKEKIKYIDGNINKGIDIDWHKVFKEFRKLGCPKDIYDPTTLPINSANWFVIASDRSNGKTTQLLLLGLVLHRMYGTHIEYIRQLDRMTTQTKTRELFAVILENGYMEKIFGDEWNSVYLYQKHWYLCNRDESGRIKEKCVEDFMFMLSVDKCYDYKSSYSSPRGDLILLDEFMSNNYYEDEFVDFCQIISTIRRTRISTKVICASNMITPYNQYLEEMGIRETLIRLKPGEDTIVKTILGLNIYVTRLKPREQIDTKQVHFNLSYFGFANKKLRAITGSDWQIRNYPHLPRLQEDEIRETVLRDIYLSCFGKYVCLEICRSTNIGNYILFRPYYQEPKENCIVFTDYPPMRKNEIYGTNLDKIWRFYKEKRDFYSSNEVGHLVETFVKTTK